MSATVHLVDVHPVDEGLTLADGVEKSPFWVDCECGWWAKVQGRANALQRADAHLAAHPLPVVMP